MIRMAIALLIALAATTASVAAKPLKEMFGGKSYDNAEVQQFVESLDYEQGKIPLAAAGIELHVPQNFYYLPAASARRVIIEMWSNPPALAEGVLGMVFPAARTPADETWGAVITYAADGYISDEDAANINYSDLLQVMKEQTLATNDERLKQGFPSVKLVGWASPPYYDKATNKLHWAKELAFDGVPKHTLNYFVRALGRHGVLNINFVAEMDKLSEIRGVIPAVMSMPQFVQGSRYKDYTPSTDKVAAYGISGLIAGGLAQKLGLFAMALAFLKKGWIFVILAIVGIWKSVSRWFGAPPEPNWAALNPDDKAAMQKAYKDLHTVVRLGALLQEDAAATFEEFESQVRRAELWRGAKLEPKPADTSPITG